MAASEPASGAGRSSSSKRHERRARGVPQLEQRLGRRTVVPVAVGLHPAEVVQVRKLAQGGDQHLRAELGRQLPIGLGRLAPQRQQQVQGRGVGPLPDPRGGRARRVGVEVRGLVGVRDPEQHARLAVGHQRADLSARVAHFNAGSDFWPGALRSASGPAAWVFHLSTALVNSALCLLVTTRFISVTLRSASTLKPQVTLA